MKAHVIFISLLSCLAVAFHVNSQVYVYAHGSSHAQTITDSLKASNITFELTDTIIKNDVQNLYIICDAFNLDAHNFPHYYITYQSLDLTHNQLTNDYFNKLSNSVAVWDYSFDNINRYRGMLHNYLYMPQNYAHADPVVLPCRLPVSVLATYKELLCYSNQKDTDISSHLPALFAHTILQNPKIIVEAGVRGGESTKPLYKATQFCKSNLIGVDIDPMWAKATYNAMDNAFCLEMSDVDFADYYLNSSFKDKKIDLVFIDTSHEYQHTLQEITVFVPLLNEHGALMFHDSNVTPLERSGYVRLNGSWDSAPGNPRGVPQAIKEYFALDFNEYAYSNITFTRNGITWHMTHYPFCNGLTIMQKQ